MNLNTWINQLTLDQVRIKMPYLDYQGIDFEVFQQVSHQVRSPVFRTMQAIMIPEQNIDSQLKEQQMRRSRQPWCCPDSTITRLGRQDDLQELIQQGQGVASTLWDRTDRPPHGYDADNFSIVPSPAGSSTSIVLLPPSHPIGASFSFLPVSTSDMLLIVTPTMSFAFFFCSRSRLTIMQ